ncbi:hypothetical protein PAMA_015328 [Pampus argenteus]
MKITVCFVLVLCALSAAGERIQARLNEKVTIKCGTFSESLLWYHGTDEVYSTKFINRNLIKVNKIGGRATLKNADLIIDKVKEEDVGEYTCSADGTPYTHTLFVMSVSVNSVNASRELQQGSKVTLKCEVKGLNSDSSVKWKQPNGNQLYESPTVDLEYVTPSHAGVWVCMFSHLGNTYNESLDLTVTDLTSTSQTPKVTSKTTSSTCILFGTYCLTYVSDSLSLLSAMVYFLCSTRCSNPSVQCCFRVTGAQLVDVGCSWSWQPGCGFPDGLSHYFMQEDQKKEGK